MNSMQIHRPVVSILIPVFNRKEYIAECIESAINQTFTDIEIIIVDNASKDGTWEICQHYAAIDPRIKIFQNESNIGPVRNWMRCANEASGEFSKILFSDDLLMSNCLEEMIQKISNIKVSFVYSSVYIGSTPLNASIFYANSITKLITCKEFLNYLINSKAPLSPGAILLRTSDLLKNLHLQFPTKTFRNFENHGAGPDVMIALLSFESYKYASFISKPLIYFRSHFDSFSSANNNNSIALSYQSVILMHLKNKKLYFPKIEYTAYAWLQNIKFQKKYKLLKKHFEEFDVENNLMNIILVLIMSTKQLIKKIFNS